MDFHQPRSIDEATAILAATPCLVLAGGTDVFPAHATRPVTAPVLDISGIAALRGLAETADGWTFGAGTTWTDLLKASLPPAFDGLKLAAREVGSVQIQNRATIAGNICNASPAADGVPPLLTLDASVVLNSLRGERVLPLEDFILGNRKTARQPDELVTAIRIPKAAGEGRSHFLKLGARRYMVISIAMVAARLVRDNTGVVTGCAVAVGACSEVARRLRRLEQASVGKDPRDITTGAEMLDGLAPIGDVRATSSYRRDAARELIIRTLMELPA